MIKIVLKGIFVLFLLLFIEINHKHELQNLLIEIFDDNHSFYVKISVSYTKYQTNLISSFYIMNSIIIAIVKNLSGNLSERGKKSK